MKLLKKEDINNIIINEKAVHWNQSVIGLLVDTILTPFSWLKNLSAPTIGQVEVLAMQWGAEYTSAIIDVLDNTDIPKDTEGDGLDDESDDNTLVYDEDVYDTIKKYSDSLKQLIKDLGEVYKNTDTDIYVLHEQIKKLNMDDIILSKEFKQFIEFVYTDNKVHYEKIITAFPYDTIIKPHIDKIEEITKNIITKATDNEYKDKEFISNFIVEITELDTNITKLNEDVKILSLDILKDQEAKASVAGSTTPTQVNTNYNLFNDFLINNRNLSISINDNSINEISISGIKDKAKNVVNDVKDKAKNVVNDVKDKTKNVVNDVKDKTKKTINDVKDKTKKTINDVKIIKPKGKAELPSNVTDLMPIEMIEKAKSIKNIKVLTADKLNFASLNSIRYQANYLINSSEKNKDKLQHAFDSNILDVNNYFQDVIDTKNVMSKATGSVDADTEKAVSDAQDSLNEITGLKIEEVKKDSKFKVGEVYAFQVALTSTANKLVNAVLFVSPINTEYNNKLGNQEVFLMRYLGAYKFNKKDNKITKWNPFENVVLPTELRTGLNNETINIDTLMLTGMRIAKTYYGVMGISSGKKKQKTNSFFYEKSVLSADDIITTDIVNLKEKNFEKTLDNIRSKNTAFKIKIIQRYDVNMDEVKASTYEDLNIDTLNINTIKNKNVINDFTKLVSAIV